MKRLFKVKWEEAGRGFFQAEFSTYAEAVDFLIWQCHRTSTRRLALWADPTPHSVSNIEFNELDAVQQLRLRAAVQQLHNNMITFGIKELVAAPLTTKTGTRAGEPKKVEHFRDLLNHPDAALIILEQGGGGVVEPS